MTSVKLPKERCELPTRLFSDSSANSLHHRLSRWRERERRTIMSDGQDSHEYKHWRYDEKRTPSRWTLWRRQKRKQDPKVEVIGETSSGPTGGNTVDGYVPGHDNSQLPGMHCCIDDSSVETEGAISGKKLFLHVLLYKIGMTFRDAKIHALILRLRRSQRNPVYSRSFWSRRNPLLGCSWLDAQLCCWRWLQRNSRGWKRSIFGAGRSWKSQRRSWGLHRETGNAWRKPSHGKYSKNKLLYENARVTVGESHLLVMAFILRHKLSMVAASDLLELYIHS